MRHSSSVIRHSPFVIILVAYLTLAVGYSLVNPLYESTDELRHFRYVRHVVVNRSLPVLRPGAPRAQSHHPPLYYALGAMVSWWVPVAQDVYYDAPENPFWAYRYWEVSDDNKNLYLHGADERFPFHGVALAVYVVRWMTILLGAGVVWLTYRAGRDIFPRRPALALGGASLVAFTPQFLYLSGAISNDVPAALCSAAVLLASIRLAWDGPSVRADVTLGLLYGLALLTKFNLLALAVPIALAYLIAAWPSRTRALKQFFAPGQSHLSRSCTNCSKPPSSEAFCAEKQDHERLSSPVSPSGTRARASNTMALSFAFDWRALLRGAGIVMGLAALLSGWWFWRNQVLYGDPTGMKAVNDLWAGRSADAGWWAVEQGLPYLWSSFWGRFGYGQVPMPRPIYRGLLALCLVALGGYLIPRQGWVPGGAVLLLLVVTILTSVAVVVYYMLIQPAGAMGRFLFPAFPAFALLLVGGLSRFLPDRLSWAVSGMVTIGMLALAVYALVGVLTPAFAPPRPLSASEIEALPNPTNVEFGAPSGSGHSGVARLLGYRVTPRDVQPGDTVEVTLYWQPLARTERNYAVFVHLLSDGGEPASLGTMIAQRDTYPGLGRYLTTAWDPGVVFADTYRVHVPETAYVPDEGYVQVGLYLPDGPRLTTPGGRDAVRLARIEVSPQPGEIHNSLNVNFGDKIALIGYELDRRVAQPGETIHLTLYWKALNPMEVNYKVFVHVLGEENQIWANTDSPLTDEAICTNRWEPGTVVKEDRELTLVEATPPDFYDIELGLHASGRGRLKILAEDGRQIGDRTLLTKIRVVGE